MKKGFITWVGSPLVAGWWRGSVSCWVLPTRGGQTTDVEADLLCQPWEGRVFSKPFLGRNNVLPWPGGNSPSHAIQCFCSDSMAWVGGWVGFGGEATLVSSWTWGCCWGRAMWAQGAWWVRWSCGDNSLSPLHHGMWGGGRGSRNALITWLCSYGNQHKVFMAFKATTPMLGIFERPSPGVRKL